MVVCAWQLFCAVVAAGVGPVPIDNAPVGLVEKNTIAVEGYGIDKAVGKVINGFNLPLYLLYMVVEYPRGQRVAFAAWRRAVVGAANFSHRPLLLSCCGSCTHSLLSVPRANGSIIYYIGRIGNCMSL